MTPGHKRLVKLIGHGVGQCQEPGKPQVLNF